MNSLKKYIAKLISFIKILELKTRHGEKIKFGKNVICNFKIKFKGKGKVVIGNNVNLWSHKEYLEFHTYSRTAKIIIGSGSRVNGAQFHSRKLIVVGRNNLIGSAIFLDNDFHSVNPLKRNKSDFITSKKIYTKDSVWICGQSAILKGVSIGENSVVGFRSVVASKVPDNVVVAGNPAKIIKSINL